jgi:hypothetical protein
MFSMKFLAIIAIVWAATPISEASAAPAVSTSAFLGAHQLQELRANIQLEPNRTCLENVRRLLKEKRGLNSNIDMQMGTLLFVVDGDIDEAARAARLLLEFCGSWQKTVPEVIGKDERSLPISREVQNVARVYGILQNCDVFTESERRQIEETLILCASRLMERGTSFNHTDYFDPKFRCSNWNTDRLIAVGMVAMAVPGNANSRDWLAHVVGELRWQLDSVVTPGGAWPEGTRYHGAVLRALAPFALELREQKNIDLFDNPNLKAMFEALVRLQSPRDQTIGRITLTPGVFDANWENVWSCVLAWGATAYRTSDPTFAGRLIWAWHRAGSPFYADLSPGNPVCSFLYINPTISSIDQPPLRSEVLGIGYAILRDQFDGQDESMFLFNVATERGLWHQHFDRGSFSLYAFGTPLSIDPGVQSYGDETRNSWFMLGKSHNLVQFEGKNNRGNGKIAGTFFSEQLDYVDADLTDAVGYPYHRRVAFIKPHTFLIWDHIEADIATEFQLHALVGSAATPRTIPGSAGSADQVVFNCPNDIDLDFAIIEPRRALARHFATLQKAPYPVTQYVGTDDLNGRAQKTFATSLQWLSLRNDSTGGDYLTALHARRHDPTSGAKVDVRGESQTAGKPPRKLFIDADGKQAIVHFSLNSATEELANDGLTIELSGANNATRTFVLLNQWRFIPEPGYSVHTERPGSLTLEEIKPGTSYELTCADAGLGRIDLRLPWAGPLDQVHVFAGEREQEIDCIRIATRGAIQFAIDRDHYHIKFVGTKSAGGAR